MDLTNYSAYYIWLDAGYYRSTLISDIKLIASPDADREIQPVAIIDDQEIIMDPACYPIHKYDDNLPSSPNYSYKGIASNPRPKGCDNGTNVVALGGDCLQSPCTINRHPTVYLKPVAVPLTLNYKPTPRWA